MGAGKGPCSSAQVQPPAAAAWAELGGIAIGDMDTDARISQRLVGRMGAVLFLAGGLGSAASVLLPASPTVDTLGVALSSLAAMLVGAVVWFLPWQRWPRAASLVLVPVAFALIAIGNHVAGAEPYRYDLFFVISFVWIGFAHPRGTSLRFAPLFLVAYLGPLFTTGNATPVALGSTLIVAPICLVVGEAMAWVSERLRGLERERLLESSEARFRALVHNAADVILILGADLSIQYESPAVERVLGHRVAQRIGRSPLDIVHPDDGGWVAAALRELAERPGAELTTEYRVTDAAGAWHVVEASAQNLLDDPNVRGMVLNYRDVSERHALDAQLRHQALHDPLTGLPNRALFQDRAQHALARRARRASSVAIVLADLDDFRTVNDGLGHAVGDRLLQAVGQRLQAQLRAGDTVARLGGDEFAILLEDVAIDDATLAADRTLATLRAPIRVGDHKLTLGASIGVAVAASRAETADELIRHADAAMYLAKQRGRGQVAVFDPSLQLAVRRRLGLKADLGDALARGEFRLHYQPLVDLRGGRIVGVEALIRWQHPALGLLLPGEFISLAEESGAVVDIGRWVLEEACRQAIAWDRTLPSTARLGMSVNLSAVQLHDAASVDHVSGALRASGLTPERLTLEITESLLVVDSEATIAVLKRLKGLGVRLAIDDFGTGYSSLSYLRRFPIDTLKIDRSFVAALGTGREESTLVRSIVKLAQSLHLETVAEGVEEAAQAAKLRLFGADIGQGYYFAAPQEPCAVVALLDQAAARSA